MCVFEKKSVCKKIVNETRSTTPSAFVWCSKVTHFLKWHESPAWTVFWELLLPREDVTSEKKSWQLWPFLLNILFLNFPGAYLTLKTFSIKETAIKLLSFSPLCNGGRKRKCIFKLYKGFNSFLRIINKGSQKRQTACALSDFQQYLFFFDLPTSK